MAISDFTGKNIQDTYQRVVQTDGTNLADGTGSLLPISFDGNNIIISGSLTATEYSVSSSVTNIVIATKSGSTAFGNSTDDTHTFTGHITASGDISASGVGSFESLIIDPTAGGGVTITNLGILVKETDSNLNAIALSSNNSIGTLSLKVNGGNTNGIFFTPVGNSFIHPIAGGLMVGTNGFGGNPLMPNNTMLFIHGNISSSGEVAATSAHITNITASGNISSSGYVRALKGQFGDSPVAAGPIRDLEVRNSDTVRLRLESTGNNNQLIEFMNNQEPDFIIGNFFGDAGFQIRSDNKTFITVGATGSLSGDPAADTVEISGSVDISSNITASGNISSSGDLTANNITGVTSIESTLYTIDGINAIDYASTTHLFGSNTSFTKLRSTKGIEMTAPITASGNISASGTISANDFTVLDDIELSNNSKIFVGSDTTEIATQNDDGFIIKANGPEIMRIFSSGVVINEGSFHTVDFRVESNDDAHAFYIDSGLNAIELGRQTNTHVTASGNISASGRVYGTHFGTGNANANAIDFSTNNTLQFRLNDASRITHTTTQFRPTTDEAVSLGRAANKWKELVVNHITASGDISSSGIITANSAYVGSLNHKDGPDTSITFNTDQVRLNAGGIINTNWYTHGVEFANGHVTASGNISASGQIHSADIITTRIIAGDNDTIVATTGTNSLTFNTPITASGNISSSGTGLNYFGGNIELDDSKKIQSNTGNYIQLNTSDITFQSTVQVAKFTNGEASFNDGGQSSQDFRVESDTKTHALFVDANENKVGIGRSSALSSVDSTLDVTGDLTVSSHITASGNISSSGTIQANNFVDSNTRIKILPKDFVADDVGRPLMIEDDNLASNTAYLHSFGTSNAIAYVDIPFGYTATHVKISGSNTANRFTTFEGNIGSNVLVEKGSITSLNTEKDITNVATTDSNYLFIYVSNSAGVTDEIFGGYVTITPS